MGRSEARDDADTVELSAVIGRIRQELEQAQSEGAHSSMKFLVEKVSVEFAVQIRREANAKAGLRIGVVTADGGGSASRDTTHRISVELKPHDGTVRPDGPHVSVGGDNQPQLPYVYPPPEPSPEP
jgi:hypothetical protein